MDKDKNFILQTYEKIYSRYQLINHLMTFGLDLYWRKRVLKYISPNEKGLKILDICSGTGDLAFLISKKLGKSNKIFCYDFSEEMISVLIDKYNRYNLIPIIGDCSYLPFKDNTFDYITIAFASRNLLYYDNTYETALKEVYRVLKFSGTIVHLETNLPKNRIIKKFYYPFIKYFIPFIGYLVSKEKEPYKFLSNSILNFPDLNKIIQIFEKIGFKKILSKPLTFGTVAIIIAKK